jgi:signal transduction histidine kinase/ligand-binding sensor domain-containing protein
MRLALPVQTRKLLIVLVDVSGCIRKAQAALLACLLPLAVFTLRAAPGDNPVSDAQVSQYDLWQPGEPWQYNGVTCILQGRQGYLWLGTYHGLLRFDGVRFVAYDAATVGLQNGLITALYEDREGSLWIGHETGGLTRLKEGTFENWPMAASWPGGSVEVIAADEQHQLWILNPEGDLFRLADALKLRLTADSTPKGKAFLAQIRDGSLWAVTGRKLASIREGSLGLVPVEGAEDVDGICAARDGGLWVLGPGRVRKWLAGRWTGEELPAGSLRVTPTCLLETSAGNVLLGSTRFGMSMLRKGREPLRFDRTNGLTHDWVRALCEDHEGNLWIGTGNRLNGLRTRKVQMLNPPDLWQGCSLLSFCPRRDGSLWVGTEGAGLYRLAQGVWSNFSQSNQIPNNYVWSVLETTQGELYVSTWGGGLGLWQGEHFTTVPALQGITNPAVALYEGRRGELWIGTTAGLFRYEHGRITWAAGKDQLTLPDVRCFAEPDDKTLYFGMSGGGLGLLKNGRLSQMRKTDGLASDVVLCLKAESDGTLWIGTADAGLVRQKHGKLSRIGPEQGLPPTTIGQIVDDQSGNFWLGSRQGLFRVSKAELQRCADGTQATVSCFSYGKAEGLTSLSISAGFQPGACRVPDGRLLFPTAHGLAVLDTTDFRINPHPPLVQIEELLVDGKPLDWERGSGNSLKTLPPLSIAPGAQRLEIRYTGLSFAAPEKVRFKCKVENLDPDWMDVGGKRALQYNYLPPGPYVFRVVACNNDGVWSTNGASLAFVILPHFWQTWWFKGGLLLLGALGVGGSALALSRRRLRRGLERLERQRALERERARIARDIHDDLGASLTRITMLCQSVRGELQSDAAALGDVDQIYHTARDLTRAMDEIVWAVNPQHDTLDSLVTYLGRFAQNFLSTAGIRCRLDVPLRLPAWPLTSELRHSVFLALKEALNNVVKHAGATEARLSLEIQAQGFALLLADNGKGFSYSGQGVVEPVVDGLRAQSGNGLANMQRRLEEIGGACSWDTAPGDGTRVRFLLVLPPHQMRHQNT